MKKTSLIVLALCMVFMAAACKSSAGYGPISTPPWINDLPGEGEIWGIGSAKQSSASMSMTTAEARARVSIARTLDSKVKAMFTDYNLDAGNAGSQANTSMQEDVSRQITNMNVSGATVIKRWQAPDGTFWICASLNSGDARNSLASIIGNQEAAYAQFKARQALEFLDAELAKAEKPVIIDF
jgi:hypothetical protein